MSDESVLIAGLSGRALAQSARRAGYDVLVADSFGDADTVAAATAFEYLPHAIDRGFSFRSLSMALDSLAAQSKTAPIGLIIGTGFEDDPDLVDRLAEKYTLLACPGEAVRRTKDPKHFFSLLAERGIRHPETQLNPPSDPRGWLTKRVGGTGGTHIRRADTSPPAPGSHYYQRQMDGVAVSGAVLCGEHDIAVAWSHQWVNPRPKTPFRYGGAAGTLNLGEALETELMDCILQLLPDLGLKGLVSFDFLITAEGEPILLEINPRPGATLDVLDDSRGTLLRAHIEACLNRPTLRTTIEGWEQPLARAAAYLYADRGDVAVSASNWPEWVADRPLEGSHIAKYRPIATVVAEGATLDEAEASCRERLGLLENLLYEEKNGKETTP